MIIKKYRGRERDFFNQAWCVGYEIAYIAYN